nr:hypothetical protein [Tanacetum cinerariifolium]
MVPSSKELTNQAMVESKAYKTYYGFVSREKTPKPKYVKKKADSATSTKHKPVQATKGTKIKTKDKVVKSDKKKQPAKKPKAKGLAVLFEVALTEAEQLPKEAKKDFHISHASGLGDGGDSDEEDDDENDFEDDADNNNNDSDDNDNDKSDDERTESDRDEIPEPNLTNVDHTEHEEEDVDKRAHTYSNYDLTDDEKIHDEENVNEEEEDEVTKELYDDVNVNSGNKDTKMTNADQAYHPTLIPKITSSFTTPTLPPPSFFNPLSQRATPTPTPTASETTTSLFVLLDFSSYEEGETLFEFELTNILIDKLEKNKSFDVADYKRELYDALIKSYNTDKYIFESYGEVFSLKRSRDDKDKDQDASAGSDRGTKRRKSSNDAESSRDSRSKEKKSLSTSKDTSYSRHKSFDNSAHAEEPSHTAEDLGMQQDHKFVMGPPTTNPDWSKR